MEDESVTGAGSRERVPVVEPGDGVARVPVLPWERRSTLYLWGYGQRWAMVVQTRVTVWGYGRPQSMVVRNRIEETEAARGWAAARGWDCHRGGAWAGEITTPMTAAAAEKALAPILRLDPAIAGWSGRELDPVSTPRPDLTFPAASGERRIGRDGVKEATKE